MYRRTLGDPDQIGDVADPQFRVALAAVAPIVGTARVVSATSKIARALRLELEIAELEAEDQEA